jgi:NitT/TauT family transport system substrate-binding protein
MARFPLIGRASAVLALLMLVSGATSFGQAPGLTAVRLISASSDDLRPLLYAQKAGLFRRAGLDVQLTLSTSGANAAQAIVGGSMDIGKSSITSLIAAFARGLPFVLVAPSILHRPATPTSSIVVAAGAPIKTALELQGKTVSCTAIGDIAYLGLRALIDNAGGDSSTVKWVELPPSTVALAIEQGRIDAGLITEPYMSMQLKSGKLRFLVDELSGYPRPILETAYYATREYVEKNRDAVTRFARVLGAAAAYSNTHLAETVPLFASFANIDPEIAAQMHHTYEATSFDPLQIQPVIDLAAKYKIIPRPLDARDFIAAGPK